MKVKDKIREKIQKLEDIRKIKELTKGEMAEGVGVSRLSYSDWINGKKLPSWDSLDKINKYLES